MLINPLVSVMNFITQMFVVMPYPIMGLLYVGLGLTLFSTIYYIFWNVR